MRSFESLNEKEILALAITQEEEDARIYDDFADGLKESYPLQAEKFAQLRREEDGHRHRLISFTGSGSASTSRSSGVRMCGALCAGDRSGWCGRWV
jgi:hypothetical protein